MPPRPRSSYPTIDFDELKSAYRGRGNHPPEARLRLEIAYEFYLRGLTQGEIHEITGVSLPNIKAYLRNTKERGVRGVALPRGWRKSGGNRNSLLSETEEEALIQRLRDGKWGTAEETLEFLLSLRNNATESKPRFTIDAIYGYKKRFSKRIEEEKRRGAMPAGRDELLLNMRDKRVWTLLLHSSFLRKGVRKEVERMGLRDHPTFAPIWESELKSLDEPIGRMIGKCRELLGEECCDAILKSLRVERFQWPEKNSPVGTSSMPWKLLGFHATKKDYSVAFARLQIAPTNAIFYWDGFLCNNREGIVRATKFDVFCDSVIISHNGRGRVGKYKEKIVGSDTTQVAAFSDCSDELNLELRHYDKEYLWDDREKLPVAIVWDGGVSLRQFVERLKAFARQSR